MANSRPADGVTSEQITEFFDTNEPSSDAWDLVRQGIVTDYAFKVGDRPGVVVFLRADSEDQAKSLLDSIPVVTQGLLTFELDPLREHVRL